MFENLRLFWKILLLNIVSLRNITAELKNHHILIYSRIKNNKSYIIKRNFSFNPQ